MKKGYLILTLFIASFSFYLGAQEQSKCNLFIETSVFRFNYKIGNGADFLSNTKTSLPNYNHTFDANNRERYFQIKNDTLSKNVQNYGSNLSVVKDFRTFTIGFSKTKTPFKKLHLKHGFGLNYAVANCEVGNLYSDHFMISKKDTNYNFYIQQRDSSFNLMVHEQTKRLGLVYDFSAILKIKPAFQLSFGIRNSLHLNYNDKVYAEYKETVSSTEYWRMMDCFRPVINVGDFRLFHDEKPFASSTIIERKNRPQFDMSLYIKPEFLMGENKGASLYFLYGIAVTSMYGKQYGKHGQYRPTYGIGITQTL